jgi:hypothetical protein
MNDLTGLGVGGIFCIMILKLILDFLAKTSVERHLIEIKNLSLKQLEAIYKINGGRK